MAMVNPTEEPKPFPLASGDVSRPKTARLFRIAGIDPMAYNDPGRNRWSGSRRRPGRPSPAD